MAIPHILLILCISLVLPTTARAFCFEEAGQRYGISPAILQAIAKVESNYDAAAMNVNNNGTYDFGLMQINSWWADRLGKDVWASLGEPCYNVQVGAWILSRCIEEHGHTWEAIGCYHSQRRVTKKKYAWIIYNALIRQNPVTNHSTGWSLGSIGVDNRRR